MNGLKTLFDTIFKSLAIIIMLIMLTFTVITVKACSKGYEVMDHTYKENQQRHLDKKNL